MSGPFDFLICPPKTQDLSVPPSSLMDPSGQLTPISSSSVHAAQGFESGEDLSKVRDNLCQPTADSGASATEWLMNGIRTVQAAQETGTELDEGDVDELLRAAHDYNSLQSFRQSMLSGSAPISEGELKATMDDINDPTMKKCAELNYRAWRQITGTENSSIVWQKDTNVGMSQLMLQSLLSCQELHPSETHFGYQSSMDPHFNHCLNKFERAVEAYREQDTDMFALSQTFMDSMHMVLTSIPLVNTLIPYMV